MLQQPTLKLINKKERFWNQNYLLFIRMVIKIYVLPEPTNPYRT